MTADELKALSEALSSLARFCLSTAKIDSLHAEAVGEVVAMVHTLHESVTRLDGRLAAVERRIGATTAMPVPEPKPLKQPDWGSVEAFRIDAKEEP